MSDVPSGTVHLDAGPLAGFLAPTNRAGERKQPGHVTRLETHQLDEHWSVMLALRDDHGAHLFG